MEKKQTYTKLVLLSKYKQTTAPSKFDKVAVDKLGIYSESAIEPVSLKMPNFDPATLFIQKAHKSSPRHPKQFDSPRSDKKRFPESKGLPEEKIYPDKMAVFSLIAAHVGLDVKAPTWYYSDNSKAKEGIKGPTNSEAMDVLWHDNKLNVPKTLVYSNDIAILNPANGEYTKKEIKLDQFVPMEMLLEHTIFGQIKPRELPKPAASKAETKKGGKKGKKGEAKKQPEPKKEEKKQAPKPAAGGDDGFTFVEGKKKSKKGKAAKPSGHREEAQEEEEEVKVTPAQPVPSSYQPKAQSPVAKDDDEEQQDDDFEFMPTKSKTKRMKKTKKVGKAPEEELPDEPIEEYAPKPVAVPAPVPVPVAAPAPEPVKEQAKKSPKKKKNEHAKGEAKSPAKPVEKKPAEPANPVVKKKKGKKEVDPSLLGLYFDKPKKEAKEPETWGNVGQEVKKVSLDEIMKEEAAKAALGKQQQYQPRC